MKKLILLITGFVAALTLTVRAGVVADFFVHPDADELVPFTDRDNRLDLLEYYRTEGVESRVAPAAFPTSILKITALSDTAMTVEGKGVTIDIALFTPAPSDTLVVVATTFDIGGRKDSNVEYFDTDFHSKGRIPAPTYTEWIVPAQRRKVPALLAESVPFITSRAVLDPAACRVTFVNTAVTRFAEPENVFLPSVSYRFVKDKFKPEK